MLSGLAAVHVECIYIWFDGRAQDKDWGVGEYGESGNTGGQEVSWTDLPFTMQSQCI